MAQTPEEKAEAQKRVSQRIYTVLGYPDITPVEFCPIVFEMLYNFQPGTPRYRDELRQGIEEYFSGKGLSNSSVTPQEMFISMLNICNGLTFAQQYLKKTDGPDCLKHLTRWSVADRFSLPNSTTDTIDATVLPQLDPPMTTLVLQSKVFAMHKSRGASANDRIFSDDKLPGMRFNSQEMGILLGVEEGVHAIQFHRAYTGKRELPLSNYTLDEASSGSEQGKEDYLDDPDEREVAEVLRAVVTAKGLGERISQSGPGDGGWSRGKKS